MDPLITRCWVRLAVIVTFSAAALPSLAQPTPTSRSLYLPDIRKPPVVEITDAVRFASCKGMCPGVHGHIRNTSAAPVYAVELQADFYDQTGQRFRTATFGPALPVLFPGESSPFEVFATTNSYPPTWDFTYDLRVTAYSGTSAVDYRPVTVVSKRVTWSTYELEQIVGAVRNDQPHDLHAVQVVVSDRAGNYALVARIERLQRGAVMPYASVSHLGWYDETHDDSTVTVQAVGTVRP